MKRDTLKAFDDFLRQIESDPDYDPENSWDDYPDDDSTEDLYGDGEFGVAA